MATYMGLRDGCLTDPNTVPSYSTLAHIQLLRYITTWTSL